MVDGEALLAEGALFGLEGLEGEAGEAAEGEAEGETEGEANKELLYNVTAQIIVYLTIAEKEG